MKLSDILESKIITESYNEPYSIKLYEYSTEATVRFNMNDIKQEKEDNLRESINLIRDTYRNKNIDEETRKQIFEMISDVYYDRQGTVDNKYQEDLNKIAHAFYVLLETKLQEYIVVKNEHFNIKLQELQQQIKEKFGV
jgi:hypothetical protein